MSSGYDFPFPDYKDLVSKEDWEKYFKDRSCKYDDPLTLALIRASDRMADLFGGNDLDDIKRCLDRIEDCVGSMADKG